MSSQIYWAVIAGRSWGRNPKMFPMTLHKTHSGASLELMRYEDKYRESKKLFVKRFILKTNDAIHYDIMEHHYKIIRK